MLFLDFGKWVQEYNSLYPKVWKASRQRNSIEAGGAHTTNVPQEC